jgi:hypothetical protein
MAEQLNTHYYDKLLKDSYKKLVLKQNTETDFLSITWTLDNVFNELYDTLNLLKLSDTTNIKNMLYLIRNDTVNNYDSLNDIHTFDILIRTWYYVRKMELEDRIILFSQIGDIKNGPCAQGRTTRIYQIYYYSIIG